MAKMDPQQLMKEMMKKSEYLVMSFLVLILLIMFIFLNRTTPLVVPSPQPIDTSKIPYPWDQVNNIDRAVQGAGKPMDQSTYQKDLIQRNMFSYRDAVSKQGMEKDIQDKLKRAEAFFSQGSYQQAISLCDEVLRSDPNREPAKLLKDRATKALTTGGVSPAGNK
jgi:hypothetical protein